MKKVLLKMLIILISIMLLCIGNVQAAIKDGYTFGINAYRTDKLGDKYAYTFSTNNGLKYIWNVQKFNNGIANENETFYCLAQGYGDFGNAFVSQATPGNYPNVSKTPSISPSSYSGAYRLKDTGVQNTLNSLYQGTSVKAFNETTYNGLLWIFDNMYIKEEDLTEFLNKIPCTYDANFGDLSGNTVGTLMNSEGDKNTTSDDISEIEVEMVQQLAIWAITNQEVISSFQELQLSRSFLYSSQVLFRLLKIYRFLYPELLRM